MNEWNHRKIVNEVFLPTLLLYLIGEKNRYEYGIKVIKLISLKWGNFLVAKLTFEVAKQD